METADARARWAASGAMALTGDRSGPPLVAPPGVVERVTRLGQRLGIDAVCLLGERAAIAGLRRRGSTSCGGGTRLLPVDDGWIALTLARPDDIDLVPAWLELGGAVLDPWRTITAAVVHERAAELVERGRLLGLPIAAVGEVLPPPGERPVAMARRGDAPPLARRPVVVDLSSLWAGPLCAQLLGGRGARVVKVESTHRPDGARRGPEAFFDVLHAGHRAVAIDFRSPAGVATLRELLAAADVVIEASRPRALEQLGIDADALLRSGPRVWVSITGHGRAGPERNAVGFGDDGAAAGGLVAWTQDGRPRFVADAVADPLTGIAAADAAATALDQGGRWLVDAAMARVSAYVAGPERDAVWTDGTDAEASPPRARVAPGQGPAFGEHTDEVAAELLSLGHEGSGLAER